MSGVNSRASLPRRSASVLVLAAVGFLANLNPVTVCAQSASAGSQGQSGSAAGWQPPVMDNPIIGHVLFNQLEGRTNGPDNEFRWDGEGWIGTDMNRLWFKSEGFLERGRATDGDTEALYDRPIPFLRYFDAQAGGCKHHDSKAGRPGGEY